MSNGLGGVLWKISIVISFFVAIHYGINMSSAKEKETTFTLLLSTPFLLVLTEISDKLSDIRFYLSRLDSNSGSKGRVYQNQFTGNTPSVKAATTWDCPKCGTASSNAANFCQTCGYRRS